MFSLSRILYGFSLRVASVLLGVTGWFNPRINRWLKDRKDSLKSIQEFIPVDGEEWVWMHCSSLGEYEQGRPVLEEVRKREPEKKILLTFFSSSGYDRIKKDTVIDRVEYLPFDFRRDVKIFIDKINPSIGIFVKYDLWPAVLLYAEKNKVRLYLISAVFHSKKWFLSQYSGIFNLAFNKYTHIFVQNAKSYETLSALGYTNISMSGDSRIDRVHTLSNTPFEDHRIESWLKTKKCMIFGSTHSGPDDKVVLAMINRYRKRFPGEYKFLIFPHHTHLSRIEELNQLFPEAVVYTRHDIVKEGDIMIVDTIGILSKSYRLSDVVYIGGGFGRSVHNLLEPAVYGNMMVCGNKIKGFPEACDFIEMGLLLVLKSPEDIFQINIEFEDGEKIYAKKMFKEYFLNKAGVSKKIVDKILYMQNQSFPVQ